MWASTSSRVMRPPVPVPVMAPGSRPYSLTRRRTTGESRRLSDAPSVAWGTGGMGSGPGTGPGAGGAGGSGVGPGGAGAGPGSGAGIGCGAGIGSGCGTGSGAGAGGLGLRGGSGLRGRLRLRRRDGGLFRRRLGGRRASRASAAPPLSAPASAAPSPTTAITEPTDTVAPSSTRISSTVPAMGDGTSVSTLSVDTSKSGSSSATASPTALNHLVMVPSVTVSPSWGRVTSAIRRSGSFR